MSRMLAALDAAYPIIETPHASVRERIADDRAAFCRGWEAKAQSFRDEPPVAYLSEIRTQTGRRITQLIRPHTKPFVPEGYILTPLYPHPTEANDLLRRVVKEADEFAAEMGFKPGELQDPSGLLATIRAYVEALDA